VIFSLSVEDFVANKITAEPHSTQLTTMTSTAYLEAARSLVSLVVWFGFDEKILSTISDPSHIRNSL
jgi:hypothetical protein